jgi:hypothetical protein
MTDSEKIKLDVADAVAATLTPSQEAVAESKKTVDVTDSLGRTITLMKPSMLKKAKIARFLGKDSSNLGYLSLVTPYYFVVAVNKLPRTLENQLELDSLMEELGDPGWEAIIDGINAHFASSVVAVSQEEANFEEMLQVKK